MYSFDAAVHDMCFGLCFGMGFSVAYAVVQFIGGLLTRAQPPKP
jgi:hypothetical protein